MEGVTSTKKKSLWSYILDWNAIIYDTIFYFLSMKWIVKRLQAYILYVVSEYVDQYVKRDYPEFLAIRGALKKRRSDSGNIEAKDIIIVGDIYNSRVHVTNAQEIKLFNDKINAIKNS